MVLASVASFVLAGLIGFIAHRAGVCTVRAVAEVRTMRRASLFISFAKIILWVMVVSVPLAVSASSTALLPGGYAPTLIGLAGGVAFGVGAALNGACAISTVTRLGNGDVGLGLAILGMGLGLLVPAAAGGMVASAPRLTGATGPGRWMIAAWGLLWGWAAWELIRIWRTREQGSARAAPVLAERWRLSVAAAVMGLSNGIICALAGSWAYTASLSQGAAWLLMDGDRPRLMHLGLAAMLVTGVVTSAVLRRSFQLRWRPNAAWLRHFTGGTLMGVGIAFTPGGNDALLHAIPGLSPHAIPAYAAMVAGIWITLSVMSPKLKDTAADHAAKLREAPKFNGAP
jgi:hypothetical protein